MWRPVYPVNRNIQMYICRNPRTHGDRKTRPFREILALPKGRGQNRVEKVDREPQKVSCQQYSLDQCNLVHTMRCDLYLQRFVQESDYPPNLFQVTASFQRGSKNQEKPKTKGSWQFSANVSYQRRPSSPRKKEGNVRFPTNLHGVRRSARTTSRWAYPKTKKKREPQPEAAVSFRTVVTFVTWLICRTEFSSSELVL